MKDIKRFISKITDNRGETMVEVMVAFIVLLMVLAIFGNSISATGEAEKYANEIRQESYEGMKKLKEHLVKGSDTASRTTNEKSASVTGTTLTIKAVQYKTSDNLIYWVFE
ncbi:MAG: hypothetical protein K6F90_01700 [Lachnospiraceae bacterium]|nr:hypothetical protein [Lachnospiraceae bacterium]